MTRPLKIISAALLIVIALIFAIWKIASEESPTQPVTETGKSTRHHERARTTGDSRPSSPGTDNGLDEAGDAPNTTSEQSAAAKDAIIEKIHDASTTYEAAYLPIIEPYLTHADPEIRETAVDAMIVLGDSAAAPMLREAAIQMKTAKEVKNMLEAAEFLELPEADLTKYLKRNRDKNAESEETPRIPRSLRRPE